MESIYFEECNTDIAKNQDQYITLPAHIDNDGIVTSCWKLTWIERFKVLFSGRVFLCVMAFHRPLQPQRMTVNNPVKVLENQP
ncbi:MAG TPA: hypothetical protein VMW91_11045 [Desulfosporosinus sp.]|nr:hypothetical protein [Desulfosporosinus sp.]